MAALTIQSGRAEKDVKRGDGTLFAELADIPWCFVEEREMDLFASRHQIANYILEDLLKIWFRPQAEKASACSTIQLPAKGC